MRTRATAALAAAVALACETPVTPARGSIYSYADTFNGGRQVFHWPAARLPVRYYARPEGDLEALMRGGLARWEGQFLYGEFRAGLARDSSVADVVVAFEAGPPPSAPPDTSSTSRACEGVTTFLVDSTNTVELPLRVTLRWFANAGFTPGEIAACVDRVLAHELGHTLGLINGSHDGADSTDLMYAFPRAFVPTPRDRATVEVLYHTIPTIVPAPR